MLEKISRALWCRRTGTVLLMLTLASACVAGAQGASLPTLSLLQTLPILPGMWVGVAALIVLIIIAVAVMVYMLAGLLDSQNAKAWARFQIYEGILSIILIVIFLAFVFFFFLNPQQALSSVGLLPQSTQWTGMFDCSQAYDIFSLATCNLARFNTFTFGVFQGVYETTILLGFTVGLGVSYTVDPLKLSNFEGGASAGLSSLIPFDAEISLSTLFSGLLFLFILTQIQLLLISGALLWLGFFVSLGLIARSFGFTRTFGGAMIAMGIGLGIIYPLVVNLTYGFVNTQLSMANNGTGSTVTGPIIVSSLLYSLVQAVFNQVPPAGSWIFPLAMAIAGMTFIPFLNFTIVDAFIIDFSKAIGERLDFMSILINVI